MNWKDLVTSPPPATGWDLDITDTVVVHRSGPDGLHCAVEGLPEGACEVGPVGLHPPNGFGLFDMIGNGWEWVEDCFVPWHHEVKSDGSAHVFHDCELVVFKGGTAIAEPWQARAAMRVGPHPYNDGEGSVIRLLREMPAP